MDWEKGLVGFTVERKYRRGLRYREASKQESHEPLCKDHKNLQDRDMGT